MLQLEIVTFITKRYWCATDRVEAAVSSLEIYPLAKAYGGRPLTSWKIDEKDLRYFVGLFGHVSTKSLLERVFKIVGECGYDMNSIYKIVTYKEHSDGEVERCFIWERGKPLAKGFNWK
jgi:hypothetical protein